MEKSGSPFDKIRKFFQPSQTFPRKISPQENKIKGGGFIIREGKQYYLSTEFKDELNPTRYKEVLKEAIRLFKNDSKTNEVSVYEDDDCKKLLAKITFIENQDKIETTRKSKLSRLDAVWKKFTSADEVDTKTVDQLVKEAKRKHSLVSELQRSLIKLCGENFPIKAQTPILTDIASDKKLYKDFQDFLILSRELRKENLKNLKNREPLREGNARFMQKRFDVQTALNKLGYTDSFIEKIEESAGIINNRELVNELLTQIQQFKSPIGHVVGETASHEEILMNGLGFAQTGVRGIYIKNEIQNARGGAPIATGEQVFTRGDFVLTYAIPEKNVTKEITIKLDLSSLEITDLEQNKKILELLKIGLSKSPVGATSWLDSKGDPGLNVEDENKLREEVRSFLGNNKYLTFLAVIANPFFHEVNKKMASALISLGHPEPTLPGVTTMTLEEFQVRSRVIELREKYGLDLSGRINDLTLTNEGVLCIKGNLKLGKELKAFPMELEIEGHLDVRDCSHLPIPEGLKFGDRLLANKSQIVPLSYRSRTSLFY